MFIYIPDNNTNTATTSKHITDNTTVVEDLYNTIFAQWINTSDTTSNNNSNTTTSNSV